jgi:hypothetical protein
MVFADYTILDHFAAAGIDGVSNICVELGSRFAIPIAVVVTVSIFVRPT